MVHSEQEDDPVVAFSETQRYAREVAVSRSGGDSPRPTLTVEQGAMFDVAARHRAQDPTRAALALLGVGVLSHFRDGAGSVLRGGRGQARPDAERLSERGDCRRGRGRLRDVA